MSFYMQDDPMQGILFNSKSTIKFRDPLNRREKMIAGIKKIRTIKLVKAQKYTPTFSTDLMPSQQITSNTELASQFRGSTTKIVLK